MLLLGCLPVATDFSFLLSPYARWYVKLHYNQQCRHRRRRHYGGEVISSSLWHLTRV